MKQLWLLTIIAILLSCKDSKQIHIKGKDAYKYIGKEVRITDSVFNYSDSGYLWTTWIEVGSKSRSHHLTVIISNDVLFKVKQSKADYIGRLINLKGLISGNKDEPLMIVYVPSQMIISK